MEQYLKEIPLIAILRGVKPEEVLGIGEALYSHGVRAIEVPLNSPEPLESIRILAENLPGDCLVGAGTVISIPDVENVKQAGGQLIVTPNCYPELIQAAVAANMIVAPGVATPSEAFAAVRAGATWLKLFPASTFGTEHLKAMLAVLPASCKILAVGGVGAGNIPDWQAAGAVGFGIASELYKIGDTADVVAEKAAKICASIQN